jgi:hypothetical protein
MDVNQQVPIYSRTKILKALVATLVGAMVILVLCILPAEYGIDITGFGGATGLTDLGTMKGTSVSDPFLSNPWPYETTTEKITVAPRKGVEYKFQIPKGNVFLYTWSATEPIYYDFHGEPKDDAGKAFLPYKSYEIDTAGQANGSLITEFMGTHGWFWRNDSSEPITITLTAAGFYEVVGIIHSTKTK